MEVENQVSFISPMLQNTQFGNVDDETTITFKEDAVAAKCVICGMDIHSYIDYTCHDDSSSCMW